VKFHLEAKPPGKFLFPLRTGGILVLWLALASGGTVLMARYSRTPGVARAAPEMPRESLRVCGGNGMPMLLMFVHPQCSCSESSIGELAKLAAHRRGQFQARVLFVRPPGMEKALVEGKLWEQAGSIPGVEVSCDEGGVEAERFHAETSGYTILYSRDGFPVFEGGITAARGHAGDNAGSDAVEALLAGGLHGKVKTPVFGCALRESESVTGGATWKP
jgi:hypothetical protein